MDKYIQGVAQLTVGITNPRERSLRCNEFLYQMLTEMFPDYRVKDTSSYCESAAYIINDDAGRSVHCTLGDCTRADWFKNILIKCEVKPGIVTHKQVELELLAHHVNSFLIPPKKTRKTKTDKEN